MSQMDVVIWLKALRMLLQQALCGLFDPAALV
jgi:hypothetical protein